MGLIEIIHGISNYQSTASSFAVLVNDMHDSFNEIKSFEGFEPTIRPCPAGYYTVGYGIQVHRKEAELEYDRNAKIKRESINETKLLKYFPNYFIDCEKVSEEDAEKAMIRYIVEEIWFKLPDLINNGIRINTHYLAALDSLVYNVGLSSFSKSKMLRAINNNDWRGAKRECDWGLHGEHVWKGIRRRRKIEQEHIEEGIGFERMNRIRKIY